MLGKVVTFEELRYVLSIYVILKVNECCGTVGSSVSEAYFALFSMGARHTGLPPAAIVPSNIYYCINMCL